MTRLAPLPIGISTLRKIIERGCSYVDKTEIAYQLVSRPGPWFLSRPRRFGKSLFVDTLKEIFEGEEALFRGLYIHDKWDWSVKYPVIKLDFADGVMQTRAELDQRIRVMLIDNQSRLGVTCDAAHSDIAGCFAQLMRECHAKYGQRVVVLIDEYDKPILDNIEYPERATEVREGLKNLYSVLKGQDSHIHFIFVTGITKFSRVSLFSGLNQLQDITLSPRYATICGYTQQDIETTFAGHLIGVDMAQLKHWYNGYKFLGESVYNPFDVLLFISEGHRFRNYWFETGSPSFLIKLFQQRCYFLPDLEAIEVSEEILDSFDIERIDPITLLFQAGYLTIDTAFNRLDEWVYRLRVPNHEVRMALNNQFINAYADIGLHRPAHKQHLFDALKQGDVDACIAAVKRLFASIPWRNFTQNELPEMEGYYASVLYAFFASLNAHIIPEDITNHGQVDLTIQLEGYTYVMEIKVSKRTKEADLVVEGRENAGLKQIQSKKYSEKYRGSGKGVFEVGLIFGREARNLVQADWCKVL